MPAGIGYTGKLARMAGVARGAAAHVPRSMIASSGARRVGRAGGIFAGGGKGVGRLNIPRTVGRSSGAGAGRSMMPWEPNFSMGGGAAGAGNSASKALVHVPTASPHGSSRMRQIMTNKYVWGGAAVGAGALAISRNTGRPTDQMGRSRPTGVYQY